MPASLLRPPRLLWDLCPCSLPKISWFLNGRLTVLELELELVLVLVLVPHVLEIELVLGGRCERLQRESRSARVLHHALSFHESSGSQIIVRRLVLHHVVLLVLEILLVLVLHMHTVGPEVLVLVLVLVLELEVGILRIPMLQHMGRSTRVLLQHTLELGGGLWPQS